MVETSRDHGVFSAIFATFVVNQILAPLSSLRSEACAFAKAATAGQAGSASSAGDRGPAFAEGRVAQIKKRRKRADG
jgi:hypothetical protein